jgi:hypothetical protein
MAAGGGGAEEVLGGFDLGVVVLPPLGDGGTNHFFHFAVEAF